MDLAEGGRGLHIVRMLAADSGVSGDATGRIVWFEVTF
ncbi:ATP-binding protein [Actinoallomurus acanthiterrae]